MNYKNESTFKKGKWGTQLVKGSKFSDLPEQVQNAVIDMESFDEDADWLYFASESRTWLIARLWEDIGCGFEVIASEIKYVGQSINWEAWRNSTIPTKKGKYER